MACRFCNNPKIFIKKLNLCKICYYKQYMKNYREKGGVPKEIKYEEFLERQKKYKYILIFRQQGHTLRQIAHKTNKSYERIRQILLRYFPDEYKKSLIKNNKTDENN